MFQVIVKNVNFNDTEELAVFLDLVPNVKQKLRSLDAFDSLTALCPSIKCNPSLNAVQSGGQDRIL